MFSFAAFLWVLAAFTTPEIIEKKIERLIVLNNKKKKTFVNILKSNEVNIKSIKLPLVCGTSNIFAIFQKYCKNI